MLPGIAAAAGMLLLSGCGAGQIAETANKVPSAQGVDFQVGDGRYAVRGALIAYPGIEGYQAGDDAVLNVVFYNDSPDPVTVTVTSPEARAVVITTVAAATSPSPTGSPSPDESPSASPTAGPARVEVPPLGYAQLNTEGEQVLQLVGLSQSALPGQNITLAFDFGGADTVTSSVPVAVPLTPVPPPSPIIERHTEYEGEGGH
nr:hypothetical protein [Micromonospora tarapacensis]